MSVQVMIVPLFLLWGLATALIFFRNDISWLWKISVIIIFSFYLSWFWSDFLQSWDTYNSNFATELTRLIRSLAQLLPLLLLFLWPFALFKAYNSNSVQRAEKTLRIIVLLTLFYWFFWTTSTYYDFPPENWSIVKMIKKVQSFKTLNSLYL